MCVLAAKTLGALYIYMRCSGFSHPSRDVSLGGRVMLQVPECKPLTCHSYPWDPALVMPLGEQCDPVLLTQSSILLLPALTCLDDQSHVPWLPKKVLCNHQSYSFDGCDHLLTARRFTLPFPSSPLSTAPKRPGGHKNWDREADRLWPGPTVPASLQGIH